MSQNNDTSTSNLKSEVRVRFAPSPTGHLHVGGARSALYNYLFAKKNNGKFIVRVEDTDVERSTEESMRLQLKDLKWLGLKWDEGIDPDTLKSFGEHGPYKQSLRTSIYDEKANELLEKGLAYYCFLTDEEIDKQREDLKSQGLPPHVQSPYKDWSLDEARKKIAEGGAKPVVRFKVPPVKTDYKFSDLVRGEISFPSDMVGDFVIIRSNGLPVYNFCCVVDDALMKISHVFRAEEHLSNTLRQLMIYEALNFDVPQFGHVSLVLGEDRQKLSKRHGATSCEQFKDRGFLPEALNNFIALLGWSSPEGQEILSMQELEEQFSETRLNPAPAVFDEKKLTWVNATHLRALDNKVLWSEVKPYLDAAELVLPEDDEWIGKSLNLFKTSMETLKDSVELYKPISNYSIEDCDALTWDSTKAVVGAWKDLLESNENDFIEKEEFVEIQNSVKKIAEVKGKHLFMPIRVAVIGKPQGAELKDLVPLINKKELINRANQVLDKIN